MKPTKARPLISLKSFYRARRKPDMLFGTREVALIVDCPQWRVKNFMQPAYGLPPSQMLGDGGRGSRRLYSYLDVKRIQIAEALVRCGFAPEAVGAGVREIPQSILTGRYDLLLSSDLDEAARAEIPMLVAQGGEWSIMKAGEATALLAPLAAGTRNDILDGTGDNLFVLNVVSLIDRMFWRHLRLEANGKMRRWLLLDEDVRRLYEESEG